MLASVLRHQSAAAHLAVRSAYGGRDADARDGSVAVDVAFGLQSLPVADLRMVDLVGRVS